jgi:hypothetical protein
MLDHWFLLIYKVAACVVHIGFWFVMDSSIAKYQPIFLLKQKQKLLPIVAEYVGSEALSTIISNKLRAGYGQC